jgi:hypothetical protein
MDRLHEVTNKRLLSLIRSDWPQCVLANTAVASLAHILRTVRLYLSKHLVDGISPGRYWCRSEYVSEALDLIVIRRDEIDDFIIAQTKPVLDYSELEVVDAYRFRTDVNCPLKEYLEFHSFSRFEAEAAFTKDELLVQLTHFPACKVLDGSIEAYATERLCEALWMPFQALNERNIWVAARRQLTALAYYQYIPQYVEI